MVTPALLRVMFIIRVTPRSQGPRMLSSVTRAKSSPKQPTTTCIQYAWGPQLTRPSVLWGLQRSCLHHWFWESHVSFYDQNTFCLHGYCENALVITTPLLFLCGKGFLQAFVQNRQILYVLDIQRTMHRDVFL
jgi:hypothetical protein